MGEEEVKQFRKQFPPYALQIGFFFNNWGVVEDKLVVALSLLLGTDIKRARMLFSEVQALGVKLKLMRRLTNTHFLEKEGKIRLLALIGDTQKLSDRRNLYAHGMWAIGRKKQTDEVGIVIIPGNAPSNEEVAIMEPRYISPEEIRADGQKATALANRWHEFLESRLQVAPSPSQESKSPDAADQTDHSQKRP